MLLLLWAETLKNEVSMADMFFLPLGVLHISRKKSPGSAVHASVPKATLRSSSWSATLFSPYLFYQNSSHLSENTYTANHVLSLPRRLFLLSLHLTGQQKTFTTLPKTQIIRYTPAKERMITQVLSAVYSQNLLTRLLMFAWL
jgi:hypothetical protein